jgi:mRNA interferase MazF
VRGDLYRLRAPRNARGHEQQGERFAVAVQSDLVNISTVLVAPTSTTLRHAPWRPVVELGGRSTRVLLDQMRVVDPEVACGDFAGRLEPAELAEVDTALRLILGLR